MAARVAVAKAGTMGVVSSVGVGAAAVVMAVAAPEVVVREGAMLVAVDRAELVAVAVRMEGFDTQGRVAGE